MTTMTIHETKKTKHLGRIYKKFNKRPDGTVKESKKWTVRYKGKDYPTGSDKPRIAENLLLKLAGDEAAGNKPGAIVREAAIREKVVLMNEVFDGLAPNAKRKQNATAKENIGRVALHLRPFFGSIPASELSTTKYNEYTDRREEDENAARATINKELALLKRALKIAANHEPIPLVPRFPRIEMLPLSNVRKGFLKHADYLKLKNALPDYLVPVLVTAYHVGNRRGELLQVEFTDVEMDAIPRPQFRLYPDATKNGEGRPVPLLKGEMTEVIQYQIEMTRREYPQCSLVYHNQGEAIKTFYKAWETALDKAGLKPDLLFHDLRRTACRNLIRAGNTRKMAMAITGHKTESVFSRYDITDEKDLDNTATAMEVYFDHLGALADNHLDVID